MRMYKWFKEPIFRSNGYHMLYALMIKKKPWRHKGEWKVATDARGRPLRMVII